jgi:2-oxoglutarate ferredoxin oxidoreductase subunit beta
MNYNTLHTTHGRAIAFATGIKMAKPEMHVIVVTGDGDAAAIGGNHLIHACRRNIDITVVVFNNDIYGMTGGQYSPTTPTGEKGTTAPYGNIDGVFDIPKLAEAAGATFTGRGDCFHQPQMVKLIEQGIKHHGISIIDGVSICPTYYGRKNKKGSAVKMMHWQEEHMVDVKKAAKMTPEELQDKVIIGLLHQEAGVPEYCDEYEKIIERAGGAGK